MLLEGWRVLRPGGWLAVFDGDYATATVATGPNDPLDRCIEALREGFVHDPWLVRRLPMLLRGAGFAVQPMCSYGYVEAPIGEYMITWIYRGARLLQQAGQLNEAAASTLCEEARRRNRTHRWFGHIAFASVVASKPAIEKSLLGG